MDILIDIEVYITVRYRYFKQLNMLSDLNALGKKATKNVPDLEARKAEINKKIADSEKEIRDLDSKIIIELSQLSKDQQREVLASLESSVEIYKNKEVEVGLTIEGIRDANGFSKFRGDRFNYFVRPNNLDDDYFALEDEMLKIKTRLQDFSKFISYLRSMTMKDGTGLKKGLN